MFEGTWANKSSNTTVSTERRYHPRHAESFMFDKVMRTATPYWQKITRKINITTGMWTSSHQKLGYMVVTGHWIDSDWNLNMRVLNFCNVPPLHSGFIISEVLFKCLNEWGIIDKIGTLTVDNAAANDVALRYFKQTFSVRRDGLELTKEIVDKVRDGIKYIEASESRRIKFAKISMFLGLKYKKLILDVSTRWNLTYNMMSCAIEFRDAFLMYSSSDQGFKEYVPSPVRLGKSCSQVSYWDVHLFADG
ncbi:hypothetical protein AgCh_032813 [Apium graveolens]